MYLYCILIIGRSCTETTMRNFFNLPYSSKSTVANLLVSSACSIANELFSVWDCFWKAPLERSLPKSHSYHRWKLASCLCLLPEPVTRVWIRSHYTIKIEKDAFKSKFKSPQKPLLSFVHHIYWHLIPKYLKSMSAQDLGNLSRLLEDETSQPWTNIAGHDDGGHHPNSSLVAPSWIMSVPVECKQTILDLNTVVVLTSFWEAPWKRTEPTTCSPNNFSSNLIPSLHQHCCQYYHI